MNSLRMTMGLILAVGLGLAAAGCKSPAKPIPNPYPEINYESSLIENFKIAYELLDYAKIATLFADQDSLSYRFVLVPRHSSSRLQAAGRK